MTNNEIEIGSFEDALLGSFTNGQPALAFEDFANIEDLGDGKWEIAFKFPGNDMSCVLHMYGEAINGGACHLRLNPLDNEDLNTLDFVIMSAMVAKNEEWLTYILTSYRNMEAEKALKA